jgi:hypothetical protein
VLTRSAGEDAPETILRGRFLAEFFKFSASGHKKGQRGNPRRPIQSLDSGRHQFFDFAFQFSAQSICHHFQIIVGLQVQPKLRRHFKILAQAQSTSSDDPSIIAARHLDWQMVLAGLSQLELRIVQALADGLTLRHVGRACKVSLVCVQQLQQRLAEKVIEVMSLDAIATAISRPQWKINLLTTSEQLACKGDCKSIAY